MEESPWVVHTSARMWIVRCFEWISPILIQLNGLLRESQQGPRRSPRLTSSLCSGVHWVFAVGDRVRD